MIKFKWRCFFGIHYFSAWVDNPEYNVERQRGQTVGRPIILQERACSHCNKKERTMKVPWGKLSAMFDMDAEKLRHEIRKAKNRGFEAWGK
jgi:hypothetical protein